MNEIKRLCESETNDSILGGKVRAYIKHLNEVENNDYLQNLIRANKESNSKIERVKQEKELNRLELKYYNLTGKRMNFLDGVSMPSCIDLANDVIDNYLYEKK